MTQLTFLSEEPPASPSRSRDCAKDWLTLGGTSPSHFLPSLTALTPAGSFGKMFPVFYRRYPTKLPIRVHRTSTWTATTHPETGKRSWSLTNTQASKSMRFGVSWPERRNSAIMAGSSLLTLNGPKHRSSLPPSRSGASVCSLSDILETGAVPQRYFLTAKACQGILRRAENRGKELPELLMRALRAVAGWERILSWAVGLYLTLPIP